MGKQENESLEYSLQRYHIIEGGPAGSSLFWRKYFIPRGSNVLFYISGKAQIQEDILYLNKYDGYGKEKCYKTIEKLNAYIQSLPKWNKTKYYVRDDDPLFEILSCKTGNPLS